MIRGVCMLFGDVARRLAHYAPHAQLRCAWSRKCFTFGGEGFVGKVKRNLHLLKKGRLLKHIPATIETTSTVGSKGRKSSLPGLSHSQAFSLCALARAPTYKPNAKSPTSGASNFDEFDFFKIDQKHQRLGREKYFFFTNINH